jgi:hypothetical protein
LDGDVLLSAAWRSNVALQRLWRLDGVELQSSSHAVEEARRNLETPAQRRRLTRLVRAIRIVEPEHFTLPRAIRLPEAASLASTFSTRAEAIRRARTSAGLRTTATGHTRNM